MASGIYKMADFVSALNRRLDKIAENFSAIIRLRLREVGPARLILPPIHKAWKDLHRDPETQEMYDLMELEPEAFSEFAYVLTPKGEVLKKQIRGETVGVPIIQIATDEIEVNKAEAAAYPYSITQWLETNVIRDIEAMETRRLLMLAYSSADAQGRAVGVSAWISFEAILSEGISQFNKSERTGVVHTILMHQADFDKCLAQAMVNRDTLAMTILSQGWQQTQLFGYNFLITRKSTLLSPGVICIFASPEWLGQFTIVEDAQFFIENKAKTFTWQVFEYVALGIGNPNGIVVLANAGNDNIWDSANRKLRLDNLLKWPYPDGGL
ncbi:MAG: hypothetical protein QXO15_09765 [Nitrososphaerota archaeon]